MSYQVTAARRRPQRFEDLLGQNFVAATLQKSIESGKIAHAYLFSGPRGCGKTSSARILAKALNCRTGTVPTPCGVCTACQEITAGSSLDVIEIDGASNTSVNDVRQIKDEILFPPNASRYKIYIIDEVHMLSTSAFNALLKTIEEPPPYVIFIFATTELHKVPATIKSRCQQFNFKLVSIEDLKQALAGAAVELQIKADDDALYWIAREATGSVRDCYTLFDQVAAFSGGHITFEKIQHALGLTGSDSIAQLLTACVQNQAAEALLLTDTILQNGVSVEQFVIDCTGYIRSLLLVQHGITREALIGQHADRFPKEVLQVWTAQHLERALHIFLQLFKDIRFSINPRYELELAVSRLAWLSDYVSPQELKYMFDAAQAMLGNQGSNKMERYSPYGHTLGKKNEQLPSQLKIPSGYSAASGMRCSGTQSVDSETSVQAMIANQPPLHRSTSAEPLSVQSGKDIPEHTLPIQKSELDAGKPTVCQTKPKDIAELRTLLITELKINHSMLAIALDKTGRWQENNGELIITVKTPFEVQQLQKERLFLADKIRTLYGVSISIRIILEETTENIEKTPQLPEQVAMVCKYLKGTVTDIQKRAADTKKNGEEHDI
ncbi:MAG: DNA polymerase III subunit gamma/tau [Treponema sp.]